MFNVDNAVIMAAGTSSRFAPLSYERHKALTEVRGEVLIERQIRQIREAGIDEVFVVTGYKAKQFQYLVDKFGVKLIYNPDYLTRNNNGSIWAARDVIRNTYICSADNYFSTNPFENEVDGAYYSARYSEGITHEWCMTEKDGIIDAVKVGGSDAWYMLGHVFWDQIFSAKFLEILEAEYDKPETIDKLWEDIYIDHITELPMRIRKYPGGAIYEFDTIDELRAFDGSYVADTRSMILKSIAKQLSVNESQIIDIKSYKNHNACAAGFKFLVNYGCGDAQCIKRYKYGYDSQRLEEV